MSTTTRKRCLRGHEHCQPASIKEALDCVGHHSAQPLSVIAARVGRSESTLGKECSTWDDEHMPPLRLVVPLTIASSNDALIRFLAEACGGVFFRPLEPVSLRDVASIASVVREFGELLEAAAQATADGCVSVAERARVQHEANDTIAAIVAYMDLLGRQVQPSAPTGYGSVAC